MQNQRSSTIHDERYIKTIKILIQARKNAQLSQTELAQQINFTQPDISKIERLERRLDITEFVDIAEVLTDGNKSEFDRLWGKVKATHRK
jgi:transcriptional regulator with XRE-family HTH domain